MNIWSFLRRLIQILWCSIFLFLPLSHYQSNTFFALSQIRGWQSKCCIPYLFVISRCRHRKLPLQTSWILHHYPHQHYRTTNMRVYLQSSIPSIPFKHNCFMYCIIPIAPFSLEVRCDTIYKTVFVSSAVPDIHFIIISSS